MRRLGLAVKRRAVAGVETAEEGGGGVTGSNPLRFHLLFESGGWFGGWFMSLVTANPHHATSTIFSLTVHGSRF